MFRSLRDRLEVAIESATDKHDQRRRTSRAFAGWLRDISSEYRPEEIVINIARRVEREGR